MRKPIKNERAKPVAPPVSLAQVVGGAEQKANNSSRDEQTQLFEEDQNRYRTS